jgi:hypothetical protein
MRRNPLVSLGLFFTHLARRIRVPFVFRTSDTHVGPPAPNFDGWHRMRCPAGTGAPVTSRHVWTYGRLSTHQASTINAHSSHVPFTLYETPNARNCTPCAQLWPRAYRLCVGFGIRVLRLGRYHFSCDDRQGARHVIEGAGVLSSARRNDRLTDRWLAGGCCPELYTDQHPDPRTVGSLAARATARQYRRECTRMEQGPLRRLTVAFRSCYFGRAYKAFGQLVRAFFKVGPRLVQVPEVTRHLSFSDGRARLQARAGRLERAMPVEHLVMVGTVPTRPYRLSAEIPGHVVQTARCTHIVPSCFRVFPSHVPSVAARV